MNPKQIFFGTRVIILGLFCVASLPASESQRTGAPNILLLLADNWAWPHAGACGDKSVKTPTFDQLAKKGTLFTHAFCQVPSCSAARAVLLTGQASHRLQDAANLWGHFPESLVTYPSLLQKKGYATGYTIKGWGPGRYRGQKHTRLNPAGDKYSSFEQFLDKVRPDQPFCFWFGSHDPHQPWNRGTDFRGNLDPATVFVPPYLPDHPVVRQTITDYYSEIQRFDHECGQIMETLKRRELLENTLVIMVGDNGWQMPRGLANVYDFGTRVPMAVQWPAGHGSGQVNHELISFEDFAPTFLELAGIKVPSQMTGQSFLALLQKGKSDPWRTSVFLERERHANVRSGDLGYPCRAVRNRTHLYIKNLFPDRWPAGDPQTHWAVGPFGDVDNTPVKKLILDSRDQPPMKRFFENAFTKRPAEELYDLVKDPYQLVNLADQPGHQALKRNLAKQLRNWRINTDDPRKPLDSRANFDRLPYFGKAAK